MAAIFLLAAASTTADDSKQNRAQLLESLDAASLSTTAPSKEATGKRILSKSGKFSLTIPDAPRFGSNGRDFFVPAHSYWNPVNRALDRKTGFDFILENMGDRTFIKGHIGRLARDGMKGVLRQESSFAKGWIDHDPDTVELDVSLETYRASGLFCGPLKDGSDENGCVMVHVALHGKEVVRIHALVVGTDPASLEMNVRKMAQILSTLELHEPSEDT